MKLLAFLLLALPLFPADKSKLLVSIHLVPQENKISWSIATGEWRGTGKDRQFWPDKLDEYSIDIDAATMSAGGDESKEIARSAARKLRDIRDLLVAAANDFTVEWRDASEEEKQEKPAEKKGKPVSVKGLSAPPVTSISDRARR